MLSWFVTIIVVVLIVGARVHIKQRADQARAERRAREGVKDNP